MSDNDDFDNYDLELEVYKFNDNIDENEYSNYEQDYEQEYEQEYVQEYGEDDYDGERYDEEQEYNDEQIQDEEYEEQEYNEDIGGDNDNDNGIVMRSERDVYGRTMGEKEKYANMYGNLGRYATVEQRFKSIVYITLNIFDEGEFIEMYEKYIDKIEDLSIINPVCLVLGFKCMKDGVFQSERMRKREELIDKDKFIKLMRNEYLQVINKYKGENNDPNIKHNDILRYARYCEKLLKIDV